MDLIYALAITFVGAVLFLTVDGYEDDAMVASLLKFLVLIFTSVAILHRLQPFRMRGFRPQSGRHLTIRGPLARNAASYFPGSRLRSQTTASMMKPQAAPHSIALSEKPERSRLKDC
jgi:hypothetical protein